MRVASMRPPNGTEHIPNSLQASHRGPIKIVRYNCSSLNHDGQAA